MERWVDVATVKRLNEDTFELASIVEGVADLAPVKHDKEASVELAATSQAMEE